MSVVNKLSALRQYFQSGVTFSVDFRKQQLKKLKIALEKYEDEIYGALLADLKKSKEESWVSENGFVLSELNYALKNLDNWAKPKKVTTNLLNIPASSFIQSEPLGVVLIISPWNYPINLCLAPLIGSIAAGNCTVIKASEFAVSSSALIKRIITEIFDPSYVLFTEGDGSVVVPEMMNNFIFDHVFFTGSIPVGKAIYKLAAENLVPVTLELGGKSPCVVEAEVDIKVAARRIIMTKFTNAGQICVAPDYVLVHQSRKKELLDEMKLAINNFYGEDASTTDYYCKIINQKQFDRLTELMKHGSIVSGGNSDRSRLYIEPTLLENVNMDSPLMKEEIFGPLLPLISFSTTDEALSIIERNKNPLAFYIFTSSKEKERLWLNAVPFGGGCVNNAAFHLTNHRLPFGGKGTSGIGSYHGKFSFDTFSHKKGILKAPTWFDPSVKYPPYKGKLKMFKWITG